MGADEELSINAPVAFITIASIVNWFCYGADHRGLVFYTGGYYGENEVDSIGLLWSIAPPLIAKGIEPERLTIFSQSFFT